MMRCTLQRRNNYLQLLSLERERGEVGGTLLLYWTTVNTKI